MGRLFEGSGALCTLVLATVLGGCAGEVMDDGEIRAESAEISADCDPAALPPGLKVLCELKRRAEGRRLFDQETFGGNGRTCLTCHSVQTGTVSPEDAQARLAADPNDPLFVHDGLDSDGVGTTRITTDATVGITLPLPWYVKLKNDPSATHITVFRGIPTTQNTPALDPVLMTDLRNTTLEEQALGAIHGHAQNTVEPTENELELIAEFEREGRRFFSSPKLARYARGGPPPKLPKGHTASQKRGREFFEDAPFNPPSKKGVCALCHSGPMLNLTNEFGAQVFPAPVGTRFHPIDVDGVNANNYPLYDLLIDDGMGNVVEAQTPDPGALLTPAVLPPFTVLHPSTFVGAFKTPQLWGVADTAPYFHDNSAKTLEDAIRHYQFFFDNDPFLAGSGIVFTDQDVDDIAAFMRLLR